MGVGSGGVAGSEASEVALGLGVGELGLGSGAETLGPGVGELGLGSGAGVLGLGVGELGLGFGAGVLGLGVGVGFTSEGRLRTSVDMATPWTVFALTTKEFPFSPSTV